MGGAFDPPTQVTISNIYVAISIGMYIVFYDKHSVIVYFPSYIGKVTSIKLS